MHFLIWRGAGRFCKACSPQRPPPLQGSQGFRSLSHLTNTHRAEASPPATRPSSPKFIHSFDKHWGPTRHQSHFWASFQTSLPPSAQLLPFPLHLSPWPLSAGKRATSGDTGESQSPEGLTDQRTDTRTPRGYLVWAQGSAGRCLSHRGREGTEARALGVAHPLPAPHLWPHGCWAAWKTQPRPN